MRHLYFCALIFLIAIFAFLFERTQNERMRYKITSLQNQYERLLSENNNLQYKIDSILSRENMDAFARKKRLSAPDAKSIVRIEI
jgi:cell division protein FtsL